ncbi:MAG: hypothetical protein LBC75_10605 [Fibromonadaceae bacterium]|jgi:uncharacterized protein (TIGR02145 family)|nr:hypothetical protein [Fibromonadaceae bacterium]
MTKFKALSQALAWLVLASIVLSSCSSDSGTSANEREKPPQTTGQDTNDTEINILTSVFPSPKEQNPYSVENMNKTFQTLILANNADAKDIPKLEANFLYVRFLPYGKQGVYELKAYDTSLVLFRHPMDYNEIKKPVVYIDKTLPDSIIPYFASVPVGYEFGPTPYEILQELFLTQPLEEDDEDDQDGYFVRAKKANKTSKEVSAYLKSQGLTPAHLEAAAFPDLERLNSEAGSGSNKVLAKNIPFDKNNVVAWSLPSRWRPDGILKFIDEELRGEQPLVGVRVTAGYKFYWRESKTNENGEFKSPDRWTFSVNYQVNFDSDQFLLENGHSYFLWFHEELEIEKNNTRSAWNETFEGDKARWCVVWTAAWNYWHDAAIYGLTPPRRNQSWNWSMNIIVYYKDKDDFENTVHEYKEGTVGQYRTPVVFEDILIQTYGRTHEQIYGTTIHEITHSTHYDNLYIPLGIVYVEGVGAVQSYQYDKLDLILKESYADGVGRFLTDKHYGDGAWSKDCLTVDYTCLFKDLEDADATTEDGKSCDEVSGITVPMAEKVLFISDSWDDFKKNLMKEYPNGYAGKVSYPPTAMDSLFKYWKTGKETSCLVLSSSSTIPISSSAPPSSSSAIPISSSAMSSSSSAIPISSSTMSSSSSAIPISSSALPSSSSAILSSSSIITSNDDTDFKDTRDGYVYKTTKIGSQIWMAENLRYKADGSKCGIDGTSAYVSGNPTDEETEHCNKYGRLYDWNTAINACPSSWHLPSNEEWVQMYEYISITEHSGMIGSYYNVAKYLRDINSNGEDTYGFAALSGSGYVFDGIIFTRYASYPYGDSYWWSATVSETDADRAIRQISSMEKLFFWDESIRKTDMYSIRCVRN